MANEKYIKVAMPNEAPRVILASLRNFYISQGATITTPTNEEIIAAFPEEADAQKKLPVRSNDARLKSEIAKWKANATKQAEKIAEQKTVIAEQKSSIEELNKKIDSLEASLAETEALVETLRKQLDNNASEDTKPADEPKNEAKKTSRYGTKK